MTEPARLGRICAIVDVRQISPAARPVRARRTSYRAPGDEFGDKVMEFSDVHHEHYMREALLLADQFGMPTTEPIDTRMTSIVPGAGSLLRMLVGWACSNRPDQRILELGSGSGIGLAWMQPVLGDGSSITTIEIEQDRAEAVQKLYADEPRITVLSGDWHDVLPGKGFDIAFPDAGLRTEFENPELWPEIVELVRPGGLLVLDDLPPRGHDDVLGFESAKRRFAVECAQLLTTEVAVSAKSCVALSVRRS